MRFVFGGEGKPSGIWDGYFGSDDTDTLQAELDAWEAASDEDWREIEDRL
jgi:hypothetical protein